MGKVAVRGLPFLVTVDMVARVGESELMFRSSCSSLGVGCLRDWGCCDIFVLVLGVNIANVLKDAKL